MLDGSLRKWIGGLALLALLATSGCFSRTPEISAEDSVAHRDEAERYVLRHAASRWGYRQPRSRDKRIDYREGYYLHIGGSTECTGWLRKRQRTHVYAWVTEGSPTGKRVASRLLNAGFSYEQGFFAGTGVSSGASGETEVEAHDSIAGFSSDICQCVSVYASARLRGRMMLRANDKFCPSF